MCNGKPWLLIYDNADGPALLRKFTPADSAHVLEIETLVKEHGQLVLSDEDNAVYLTISSEETFR